MEKPNGSGSLANASTSSACSRNSANLFSKLLPTAQRLKTVFFASVTGRDQGNGGQVDNGTPAFSNCGVNSWTTPSRRIFRKALTVTCWATGYEIALIICG